MECLCSICSNGTLSVGQGFVSAGCSASQSNEPARLEGSWLCIIYVQQISNIDQCCNGFHAITLQKSRCCCAVDMEALFLVSVGDRG